MKRIVGLMLICFVANIGCDRNLNTNETGKVNTRQKEPHGISAETAILIGKGFAIFDNDFRMCDVDVIDENARWKVVFSRKAEFKRFQDGCPTFWIRKQDGEILEVMPNK